MVRWRRLLLLSGQFALVATCGAAAVCARRLVACEWLDERLGLLVTGLTTALLLAASAVTARSARTAGAHPPRRGGVRLLRLTLPVALLVVAAGFVRASLADMSVEMEALVDSDGAASPPASVVLGPGGRDVRLAGVLTEGVAGRLHALLDANPQVTRIHLTSEGGLADEGQAVGDVIAAHRLATFVPDYCVSACTLAFVRGRERLMLDDARLGFHAPYEQGLFGAMYRDDAGEQRAAYVAAGLSPGFVTAALNVEPADIWYPTRAELFAAHVITGVAGHHELPDSSLDGMATMDGARTLILQNMPELAALAERMPEALDALAAWYLDAYRRGRSEGEDADALKVVVRGAVTSTLAGADDATLLDLARFLARALERADTPEACARLATEADLIEAARQLKDGDAEAVATARALLARALDEDQGLRRSAAALAASDAARNPSPASCADRRRTFAALLAKPQQAAAMLRARLAAEVTRSLAALPAGHAPHS